MKEVEGHHLVSVGAFEHENGEEAAKVALPCATSSVAHATFLNPVLDIV